MEWSVCPRADGESRRRPEDDAVGLSLALARVALAAQRHELLTEEPAPVGQRLGVVGGEPPLAVVVVEVEGLSTVGAADALRLALALERLLLALVDRRPASAVGVGHGASPLRCQGLLAAA